MNPWLVAFIALYVYAAGHTVNLVRGVYRMVRARFTWRLALLIAVFWPCGLLLTAKDEVVQWWKPKREKTGSSD